MNGKEIASFPFNDSAQVEKAVERSAHAFEEWKFVSPHDRAALIRAFAEELKNHAADLAGLIVIETGRTAAPATLPAPPTAHRQAAPQP